MKGLRLVIKVICKNLESLLHVKRGCNRVLQEWKIFIAALVLIGPVFIVWLFMKTSDKLSKWFTKN
jgi:hypothetical protein